MAAGAWSEEEAAAASAALPRGEDVGQRLAEIHARSKAFERIATARQVQAQVAHHCGQSAWLTVTHPDPHADNP